MRYVIQPYLRGARIRPEIYGNFSEHLGRCIYGGVFVGKDSPIPNVNGMRTDVVEALRKIKLPVLRWPGGCFADEYHWKDGVGPLANRKKMINTNWGGVVEDNSFGTHEFMELCRQIGCQPYVNGNVGSGTVQEMSEWVEYMNFGGLSPMTEWRKANGQAEPWKLKYFAVGNENWGCGGNMRPEHYADVYRRYQTYLHNFGDSRLYKIACGPSSDSYQWTRVLMEQAKGMMDGLSLHYYTVPGTSWQHKGSATAFDETTYYETIAKAARIETLIRNHSAIMDLYDPEKRVGLLVDEWGTWYDVEPDTNPGFLFQQNTMRDAMVAGLTLNAFNKHADRVHMANIAQLINVLQSVILTDGEKMLCTPTYSVFDLYQCHQGNSLLQSALESKRFSYADIEAPLLSESASVDEAGVIHATICNLSATERAPLEILLDRADVELCECAILTAPMCAYNDFDAPTQVQIRAFDASAAARTASGSEFTCELPPVSAVHLAWKQR